jgi:hypothetical protein
MNWQPIPNAPVQGLQRARVSSGWLVASPYTGPCPGRVTYYHDPDHAWDGTLLDL